jgi:hypothetical protein
VAAQLVASRVVLNSTELVRLKMPGSLPTAIEGSPVGFVWCVGAPFHTQRRKQTNKQTPWPLVRERTIPTEQPPLVDEI